MPAPPTPDSSGAQTSAADMQAALEQAQLAGATLQGDVQGFDPESATGAMPLPFAEGAPTDHFNNIVGQAPLLMALGALGGVLGRNHGIAMLESTNAMMKGMVTGSAEQYQDARQQYEAKYQQWRDQSKTFLDTYKAYANAYKGRVDADARAYQGALSAVGTQLKLAQANGFTAQGAAQIEKMRAQIEDLRDRDRNNDSRTIIDYLKQRTGEERAQTASREADLKFEQLKEQVRKDDATALATKARNLQGEYNAILKQYPASAGARPPDVDVKLKSLRDQMDLVNETMDEHKKPEYPAAKQMYDQAQAKIDSGGSFRACEENARNQWARPLVCSPTARPADRPHAEGRGARR